MAPGTDTLLTGDNAKKKWDASLRWHDGVE